MVNRMGSVSEHGADGVGKSIVCEGKLPAI